MTKHKPMTQAQLDYTEENRKRPGLALFRNLQCTILNFEHMRAIRMDASKKWAAGNMILHTHHSEDESSLFIPHKDDGAVLALSAAPNELHKFGCVFIDRSGIEALTTESDGYYCMHSCSPEDFNTPFHCDNDRYLVLWLKEGIRAYGCWDNMSITFDKIESRDGSYVDLSEQNRPFIKLPKDDGFYVPYEIAIEVLAWERKRRLPKKGDEKKVLKFN